jgi:hypothetical protein
MAIDHETQRLSDFRIAKDRQPGESLTPASPGLAAQNDANATPQ